jgi:hypothetical protein
MTVNVTKPALNIREKLAELDKPSGIAGEAMLRADSVQEQRNLIGAGRKNLIINGGMQVSQRGTTAPSYVSSNSTYMTVDRWAGWASGGSYKIDHHVTAVADLEQVNGRSNFLKFSINTGNDNCGVRQMIEDVRSIPSNSPFTLSFYAKGTVGRQVETLIQANYGSGGSAQEELVNSDVLFTLSSEWTKYSVTVPYVNLAGKTIGDGSNIRVQFKQGTNDSSTSAWEFDITGVQLELGSVATDFEHRSYGEELALCQRYYEKKVYPVLQTVMTNNYSTTQIKVPFMQTKRVSPTFVLFSAHNGTAGSLSQYTSSAYIADTAIPSSAGVDGYSIARGSDTAGAIFNWHYTYTADAEL